MKRCLPSLLFLCVFSCSKVFDPNPNPPAEIAVFNQTSCHIYFVAFDREIVPVINWIPSTDPNNPNKIEAGEIKHVKLDEISEHKQGNDVVFYYWNLIITDNSSLKVDKLASVTVPSEKLKRNLCNVYIKGF